MKKTIGSFVLKLFGWKSDYKKEFRIRKGVLVAAPHTSNWDFLFALATFWKIGIDVKFLIKDSYTKSIFGFFFKALGAVGVDRKNGKNMVDYATNLLQEKEIIFIVPAEGTRKRVEKWKTGFYHIAKKAKVPVLLGFLDYKTKTSGINKVIELTDSFENDMQKIQDYYLNYTAKFPKNYNPSIY
ncbi:MAG: 1-acyl-sn-glycerol-3-phosphate acyltransferase [Flavobacteriales bacterium]|jgi:1-acyl-sn-glycerol-3-phosphate acyltransferase|nr:1-acyl-sn-glycerol-3-phosphate acyltransferase [Flavobacteriales bacterium]